MRLYLSSRDSIDLYPDNIPANFRVQLPQHIQLDKEEWVCGLTHCIIPNRPTELVYVTCNFIESSILGGKHQPVMAVVTAKTNSFQNILYTKVKDSQLSLLHVKLVNRQGIQIDTNRGETVLILEFRKNHDFCQSLDRPF